jgi:hypothetical protein
MKLLKKSTARNLMIFMTDSSDHVSGKTGLTLTIVASKDGGNFSSISPTVTEPTTANGWYCLALDTTMTNTLGDLALHITATGADPTDVSCQVVNDLPGDSVSSVSELTPSTISSAVWDEPLTGATHNVATSSGKRLRQLSALSQTDSSINDSGATTTSFVTALTSSVNGFYKDQLLIMTSGNLLGQSKPILSYNGTTKAITVSEAFTSAPANADTFTIQSTHIHPVTQIAQGVWDALTSALITSGSIGEWIVDKLDAAISTRLADADYIAPDNSSIAAIQNKTDNLPDDPADQSLIISATDSLSTQISNVPNSVWDSLTSEATVEGSFGEKIVSNLDHPSSDLLRTGQFLQLKDT